MAYRRRSYRSSTPRPGRWMDLRYAGKCQVCEGELPVGTRAYWDPADRSVTCTSIECAKQVGLTTEKWIGSPVSGSFVTVLSERRVRELTWKERYGRCEDAPCCGCCD